MSRADAYMDGSNVVVTQPKSGSGKPVPLGGEGRDWNNKLLGCCKEPKIAFCGYCCPCYMMSCVLHSIGEWPFLGFCWGSMIHSRIKIRTALGIKGSFCGDAVCSMYCAPCMLCQMYKELRDVNQLDDKCCPCACSKERECFCN